MMFNYLIVALLVTLVAVAVAMPAVEVVANVRGKKYDIKAETVEEFSTEVEALTGIAADQQSVLFRGKVLSATDRLEELGISAGEVLNVVKGRRARVAPAAKPASSSSINSSSSSANPLGDDLDMSSLEGLSEKEIMEKLGPEKIEAAKKRMEAFIESDEILEQFSDDEKLEATRQELLKNIDKYEKAMPGFSEQSREILSSPEKWREAMKNAKEQILKLREMRKQGGVPPPPNPADSG